MSTKPNTRTYVAPSKTEARIAQEWADRYVDLSNATPSKGEDVDWAYVVTVWVSWKLANFARKLTATAPIPVIIDGRNAMLRSTGTHAIEFWVESTQREKLARKMGYRDADHFDECERMYLEETKGEDFATLAERIADDEVKRARGYWRPFPGENADHESKNNIFMMWDDAGRVASIENLYGISEQGYPVRKERMR